MLAFEDALAAFPAGHVLVAVRGPERGDWQERGLVDQLQARFSLPVTVCTLPDP